MNIVVCVKHVPDATGDRKFESDNTVDRVGVDGLLSELDEYAVEQALQLKEKSDSPDDVTVTALCVGPEKAVDAVRKALQMGADQGVHVTDDAIAGSDYIATSLVLAKAVEKLGAETPVDLVVCGMASTDASGSVVPAMLAERLGLPQVTFASVIETQGDQVRVKRDGDTATEVIGAHDAAGALGDRPDRRGALPVVQGHHGGQEEAARDPVAERHRCRRRRGRALRRLVDGRGDHRPPAARGRRDRQGRGRVGRLGADRASSCPRSSSEQDWSNDMSEVLVVVDHVDGAVKKPTLELLTLARRLGEPSAVFFGSAEAGAEAAKKLGAHGAEKVYVVDDAEIKGYLVAPKAEALQQLVEKTSPAAVLLVSGYEGKEVAARLAIKTGSGLITDAVDIEDDGTA